MKIKLYAKKIICLNFAATNSIYNGRFYRTVISVTDGDTITVLKEDKTSVKILQLDVNNIFSDRLFKATGKEYLESKINEVRAINNARCGQVRGDMMARCLKYKYLLPS